MFQFQTLVYIKGKEMQLGTFIDYSLIKPIIWLHGYIVFQYNLEISTGLAALWGFQPEHSGAS
jgi:hypothetical protein